jgi:hypothetical protein
MNRPFALRLRPRGLLLAACAAAFCSGPAGAQDSADELAQGLIRLRGEVEQLNSELELLREEQRLVLAALNQQKAELSNSVDRQQLLAREAEQKLAAKQAEIEAMGLSGDALMPALISATEALKAYIRAGLPFKVEERIGELDAFRVQLENGSLPAPRGVNRLWAFFEDEFRLSRDNSLHSQTIDLGGERVLAEVAKLGSMALYFSTRDGRLGQAQRQGERWRFVEFSEAAQQAQVRALFDALNKQIRQGWFVLPVAATGASR